MGPTPRLLELLGDKLAARRLARKAGIPVIPGTDEPVEEGEAALQTAAELGFPLIAKAAFGGGGRGMRIIRSAEDLEKQLSEARSEAEAAFGNGSLFLERFIERPKHVEVQILADQHGNIVHLFERDCSVQRRHQKVVEVAPAAGVPKELRDKLCDAAVALAREVGYVNAGTVEFLLDADSREWFFIEVNPRIQVEHTVTERVTGIDLVRSQILIAQGCRLHAPSALSAPPREDAALRQRPAVPHYGGRPGKQLRAGLRQGHYLPFSGRIRLAIGWRRGLRGCGPDSLLRFPADQGHGLGKDPQGSLPADGSSPAGNFGSVASKTNVPFLENIVNHKVFQEGLATTRFLDEYPELFHFVQRRDRATRLLNYLAGVIVNGNREVAGKPWPESFATSRTSRDIQPAPLPEIPFPKGVAPPPGTRQQLLRLGPERFAQWMRKQERLLITDTTFRDAHQSLLATRVRSIDILRIAEALAHRLPHLFSLEMWGGATFDTALRFLKEDPWQRLRQLRDLVPNICFQMLFRASNAVGYTSYPDNVVTEFIKESARQGIDIFRIFDSLNSMENMEVSMAAVRETDAVCEAAICYTGDILDPRRPKYSLDYYLKMARRLEDMGAHVLAIKDMAGLCKPYAAARLVRALRQEVGIPIHFHTHDTSGVSAASILKAAESGVDVVDGAVSSHERSDQPAQSQLHCGGLARPAAGHGARLRDLGSLLGLLGARPGFLSTLRQRPEVGRCQGIPA